jgi:hypothetical protein
MESVYHRGMQRIIHFFQKEKRWFAFALFFLFCLPILLLLRSHAVLSTDDVEHHLARIANYYLALKHGYFPPSWASNLNLGFGYPMFVFAYHLPYAIATFFFISFPVSIQQSYTLTFALSYVFGMLGAYLYTRSHKLSPIISVIMASVYFTAPYMLSNIFSRGAFGEFIFLCFIPWTLYFLRKLFYSPQSVFFGSLFALSLFALITSHVSSLVWFGPLLFIYFYSLKKSEPTPVRTAMLHPIIWGVVGMLIAQPFIFPLFAENKWVWLPNHYIVLEYWKQFPDVRHLLFAWPWIQEHRTLSFLTIGFAVWTVIIFSFFVIWKNGKKSKPIMFWLMILFSCLFLMLPVSRPLWDVFIFMKSLQFPWRMLGAICTTGFILAVYLSQILPRKLLNIFMLLICVFSVIHLFVYARARGVISATDYDWFEYFKSGTSYDEYLPIWSIRYTPHHIYDRVLLREQGEKLFRGKKGVFTPAGNSTVTSWTGFDMDYTVTSSRAAEVIQKTMYYPGWKVWVDGVETSIVYEDAEFPGRVLIPVAEGTHRIQAKFTNDVVSRKIGWWLALGSIPLILFELVSALRTRKK